MKHPSFLLFAVVLTTVCHAQYVITTLDFPGAVQIRLVGINDRSEIVGNYTLPGQPRHAFLYSRGIFAPLHPAGLLGTHASAATQINNRGDITGWYSTAPGTRHGYVIKDGLITTIDYPGAPSRK